MTLGTHAVVGAAVATLTPVHPVLGFCAGFVSHFLADALPHYDYPILSESILPQAVNGPLRIDQSFMRDALHFSVDAGAGTLLALLAFAPAAPLLTVLCGAVGGILPDPLQFVAKKWPREPLNTLQRFHKWVHTAYRMRERDELLLGVVSQLALVLAVIAAARLLHALLA